MAVIDIDAGDLADLLLSTLRDLAKGVWHQELANQQAYPIATMVMSGEMGQEGGGRGCTFRLMDEAGQEGGAYGLYTDYEVDRSEHGVEGTVPWRNYRHGYAKDTHELSMNSGAEEIYNEMEVEQASMWQRMADDIDTSALQVPSSSDKLQVRGWPYYIPWSSTAVGSFGGKVPAGHTTVAGINPTDHPKYAAWADTYSSISASDFGVKIQKAIRFTKWRPAPNVKANSVGTSRLYGGQNLISGIETLAANQNDQLGFDIAATMDNSLIKRMPIQWIPALDTAAAANSDPCYMIDHKYLYPKFLRGWKFKVFPPKELPKQRTAVGTEVHVTYNWVAPRRRCHAVLAKSAPFGES